MNFEARVQAIIDSCNEEDARLMEAESKFNGDTPITSASYVAWTKTNITYQEAAWLAQLDEAQERRALAVAR